MSFFQQLGDLVKRKFSEYQHQNSEDVGQRTSSKYPQYQQQVQRVQEAFGQLTQAAGQVAQKAFMRPPGDLGRFDPGSLYGAYKKDPKEATTDVALDMMPGVAIGKTAKVGKTLGLVDGLVKQARKYKSAEEFVKYVPKEYENAKATLRYGNPNQFYVPSRLRATPDTADKAKTSMQPIITKESIDRAGNKYIEVVDGWHRLASAKQAGLKQIPILHINGSGTPIKSQLTDIYNQATKGISVNDIGK